MHFKGGKVVRQGSGLSFFYFAPQSTIVLVPAGSIDVAFLFEEMTSDFQSITVQGELTFAIREPEQLASVLDFSVDNRLRYTCDDPSKLNERLIRAIQVLARSFTQARTLNEVLVASGILIDHIRGGVGEAATVTTPGVEVIGVSITAIKATPEMTKALQADAREALLRKADEAVAERRMSAVEAERCIKENELKTEIAVEQKRREVRETQMQADVAIEAKRSELVDQKVANDRKEAQARGEALKATLEPLKDVDWKTLVAASGMDSGKLIALAFHDIADSAEKIGNLNISPDLLQSIIESDKRGNQRSKK